MQTYNIFANMTILKAAGIKAPTLAAPWTWATFRANAKKLTKSGQYGVCWGLRSPVAAVQTMSLNYGGQFFYLENGKWTFKFGPNDQNVIRQMHDMIHVDKSVDPAATGLSGSAALPAFFGGQVRDDGGGELHRPEHDRAEPARLQLGDVSVVEGPDAAAGGQSTDLLDLGAEHEQAVRDVLPRLPGEQAEPRQAAQGDWLIPSNPEAGKLLRKSTKRAGSWKIATESVVHFRKGNWVSLAAYPRWKAEVAQPAFVQYLRGSMSLQELEKSLADGWTRVRG